MQLNQPINVELKIRGRELKTVVSCYGGLKLQGEKTTTLHSRFFVYNIYLFPVVSYM